MSYYSRKHQLFGNLVYHVINRANSKSIIFHDDEDYHWFKGLILEYTKEKGITIYHYCIMPTHYHLLLEIDEPEWLSSIMANINRLYSIYHHKKFDTSGYLWQGRFKSKPIQKDAYLLTCARYIERNPVASQLVSRAEDYPYSSARHYILGWEDDIIHHDHHDPFYDGFGPNIWERKKGYQSFILNFDVEEEKMYSDPTNFERPLGDTAFIGKLVKKEGHYLPRRKGRSLS